MTDNYEIRNPTNFVAGTVGDAGDRIFYLQAQTEDEVLTLKLEKGSSQSLASHLANVLEADQVDQTSVELKEMVEPPNAAWTVGALAIGVTEDPKEIVVVAQELPDRGRRRPIRGSYPH